MADARIGLVTYAGMPALTEDDRLGAGRLRRDGHTVEPLAWDDVSVAWGDFDLLVLRSTWDYHKRTDEFAAWLAARESAGDRLWNPPALVRWNMDKHYLQELATRGIATPPTAWLERGERASLPDLLAVHGWRRAVVKPAMSATAFLTWTTTPESAPADQPQFTAMLERGAVLVQEFEEAIVRGEWSVVFLGGELSHSALKLPARGDFRVQKEYGGTSAPGMPPARVLGAAERVLEVVRFPWLYARVDLVDGASGVRLMELEMIEPDLFLRHHAEAPARFAAAILTRLT